MTAPFDAIRTALQSHDVQLRESIPAPGRSQLMVLFGRVAEASFGIDAYRHAVVVDYGEGQWIVGPPSGDNSFIPQTCSSESAALTATLAALKLDA
jgi:hypothetical protein